MPIISKEGRASISKSNKKRWENDEWRKRVSANISKAVKKNPIDRFHKMYTIDEETGCWNWNRSTNNMGYGWFWTGNKNATAHRWHWQHVHKHILPLDLFVCHHCDNPLCVNPFHMFIGTRYENLTDSRKKGRRLHLRRPK